MQILYLPLLGQSFYNNCKFNAQNCQYIRGYNSIIFHGCRHHRCSSSLMPQLKQDWQYCHSRIVESLWENLMFWYRKREADILIYVGKFEIAIDNLSIYLELTHITLINNTGSCTSGLNGYNIGQKPVQIICGGCINYMRKVLQWIKSIAMGDIW